MTPIHQFLARIRWGPEFGRARFAIGYWDRVAGKVMHVDLRDVTWDADNPSFFDLVDEDGIIIHHPNPKYLYSSLKPLDKATLDEIIADQRFRRNKIETVNMPELAAVMVGNRQGGNITYQSSMTGKEEIAGFAPVLGHKWVVGVTESKEFFAEPLNSLFRTVLYSVVLVGFVFVVIALLFARSIVRPIEELESAAHALKSGDYDKANLTVRSNDEIGRLARTFNVMIDVLRQRERERGAKKPRKLADKTRTGTQA